MRQECRVRPWGSPGVVFAAGSSARLSSTAQKLPRLDSVAAQTGCLQAVQLEYAPDRSIQGPQRSVMVNPRMPEYEKMTFPLLDMKEAIERFTLAAYRHRLTFEHA